MVAGMLGAFSSRRRVRVRGHLLSLPRSARAWTFSSHITPTNLFSYFSRQAIKKYVSANNKINVASQATFDAQFNKAIKAGVEKGEFTQPKGKSRSFLFFFVSSIFFALSFPVAHRSIQHRMYIIM